MKKLMLILLPVVAVFLVLGLLLSGGGGGGGSHPVPPPVTEEDAQIYQYTGYKLGINWELPLIIHLTLADREGSSDLSGFNVLYDALNFCKLKEDISQERETTDDEGNVTGTTMDLVETNYYHAAAEILNYLDLSETENSVDAVINKIELKTSNEIKLFLESELDYVLILDTYYDFTEEEMENITKLLEEQYFSALYGNPFELEEGNIYPGDLIVGEGGMAIPLFYQYTGGWQNIPFGGGTIKSSGCSVTSMGMVFTYLKGQTITPDQLVAWTGNRYYVHPAGQSWSIFSACATQWNLQCQNLGKSSTAVVSALNSGKPVIASMGPGTFTRAGHFIVLRGVTESGRILVNDPNDSANKNFFNRDFDLSLIMRESKNFWCFSR